MDFETEEERQEKLVKYFIIKGVSIISLIYRETKEFIFNFFHPMSRVTKEILSEAEKINIDLDLFYGDIKLYKLSDDSEVVFYEGDKARLMCILKPGTINARTEKLIGTILERFLYEFESEYAKILKEWDGDKSVFKESEKLLYDYLNVDLTYPHHSKYRGFDPDEPLERYIYEAADKFTKQVGYFYLDNLIYLTKDLVNDRAREEGKKPEEIDFPPEDEFYLAMFKLKKLGMLEKIDNFIEELQLFSKIKY